MVCVEVREVGIDQIMWILVGQGEKMGFYSHHICKLLKGFKQGVTRSDLHLKRPLWFLCGEGARRPEGKQGGQ